MPLNYSILSLKDKNVDAAIPKSVEHDEQINLHFWIVSIQVTVWKIQSIFGKLSEIVEFANFAIFGKNAKKLYQSTNLGYRCSKKAYGLYFV